MRSHRLIHRIGQTDSFALKAFVTKVFPKYFFRNSFVSSRYPSQFAGTMTVSFDVDRWLDVSALPNILKTLDSVGLKASFCCVGKLIESFPEQHRSIIDQGHEILNHTYSHPFSEELNPHTRFDALSPEQKRKEIAVCHDICTRILDYRPKGFRMPHFAIQSMSGVYDILGELGYHYSSSRLALKTPHNGLPYRESGDLVEFPISPCPMHPFQAFDTFHAFRSSMTRHREGTFFDALDYLTDYAIDRGMYVNVYFDPQDLSNLPALESALGRLKAKARIETYEVFYQEMSRDKSVSESGPP